MNESSYMSLPLTTLRWGTNDPRGIYSKIHSSCLRPPMWRATTAWRANNVAQPLEVPHRSSIGLTAVLLHCERTYLSSSRARICRTTYVTLEIQLQMASLKNAARQVDSHRCTQPQFVELCWRLTFHSWLQSTRAAWEHLEAVQNA